jgi:DNA-binding Lrp family transcriptional regulator
VLDCLIDNPRMTMSEIAKCSGLSTRVVRRQITQLQEGRAVRFTVRWDINAGDNTSFWIMRRWNQKELTNEDLISLIAGEFPNDYWTSFVVATEPIVFARFVVDDLRRANQIAERVKTMHYIESAQTLVCYFSSDFQWFGETLLQDMISNIEL